MSVDKKDNGLKALEDLENLVKKQSEEKYLLEKQNQKKERIESIKAMPRIILIYLSIIYFFLAWISTVERMAEMNGENSLFTWFAFLMPPIIIGLLFSEREKLKKI